MPVLGEQLTLDVSRVPVVNDLATLLLIQVVYIHPYGEN